VKRSQGKVGPGETPEPTDWSGTLQPHSEGVSHMVMRGSITEFVVMNFEKTFPERFWINLGRRADRRGEFEWMLGQTGMTAERFPAVDARFVGRMALGSRKEELVGVSPLVRGYESAGRYALALSKRLAVGRARQRGAEAVLLLEDDCVLHPNLLGLLEMMELPEDWGILYLGCAHHLSL